ncbi:type II toxin-antitoxin system HicB family antitoxin [Lacticaseibacillus zhaodongensis]|uniref:type II toxin-antitoxin system HicB family antitoxin n=1 Tax=Lacticaseibacillus zhaodongensis TaxID=2668065 RepID=UPI00280B8D09|nr:type II toxin-antitoxin system HicB family antitoxin [Lacticaseibacillus zhaodongensis]
MMSDNVLVYPTIFHEANDDDGHYFTVTSPNIPGMVTEGDTRAEAAVQAVDALATMLDGTDYPKPQDPSEWELKAGDSVVYISVNMTQWQREKAAYQAAQKKVRVNIMLPEYLRDKARIADVNISKVATDALQKVLD